MDFKDVITKRRAVNFFDRQKPVPDHLITEIVRWQPGPLRWDEDRSAPEMAKDV